MFDKLRLAFTGRILLITVISSVLVFAGFLAFSQMTAVRANTPDINNFLARYPSTAGSRIDPNTCATCHTSVPSLNSYGAAYKAAGRNPAALAAIESADSDGDGFSNLTEILAFTYPGNAADHPVAATATSVPPTATAVPPTATQVPPTATAVPPTATQVPPTATSVPPTSTVGAPTATSVSPYPPVDDPTATPKEPTATPKVPPTATAIPSATPTPVVSPTPRPTPDCVKNDDHSRNGKASRTSSSYNKKKKKCEVENDGNTPGINPTNTPDVPSIDGTPLPPQSRHHRKNPTRGKYGFQVDNLG